MKSILADISNKDYKQLYLLHGEEAYLKHQYRDKLKEALMDGADTMNYHYFEGKEVVIVVRSLVVGKPLSMMLFARHATLTICRSRKKNLKETRL